MAGKESPLPFESFYVHIFVCLSLSLGPYQKYRNSAQQTRDYIILIYPHHSPSFFLSPPTHA